VAGAGKKKIDAALIAALAWGATIESAAQKANVSERTVYRRLTDPAFQERLTNLRSETLQRAAAILTAASLEVVKTLVALQNPSVPAAVRLGAARSILEFGAKLRESAELERRIAALEQRHSQTGN
jgi:hypothetical protein